MGIAHVFLDAMIFEFARQVYRNPQIRLSGWMQLDEEQWRAQVTPRVRIAGFIGI